MERVLISNREGFYFRLCCCFMDRYCLGLRRVVLGLKPAVYKCLFIVIHGLNRVWESGWLDSTAMRIGDCHKELR